MCSFFFKAQDRWLRTGKGSSNTLPDLNPEKEGTVQQVLESRIIYITVALEDIYQPRNASAVLRSCECFGIQDVHIIENRNRFTPNQDVVMGADKWLSLNRYSQEKENQQDALKKLHDTGYRLVATTLHGDATLLDEFDFSNGKFALLFGTELTGLSETVLTMADEYLRIPIYGFTESYNISVSVAIILHHLTHRLHHSSFDWKLDPDERDSLLLEWMVRSVRHSGKLKKRCLDNP